jgi:hypothetical protein
MMSADAMVGADVVVEGDSGGGSVEPCCPWGGGSAEILKQSRSAGSSLRIKRCFYGGRRSLRSIYIGSSLVLAGAMEVESVCLPS